MEPEMHYTTFDTHKYIKALVAQGLKESQAETIVTTIIASKDVDISKLVTKQQFSLFENEIENIKENMATKIDVAELRSEIASVKFDILKWIIPIMLTNTVTMLGLIISMFLKK
jgi:hypothetical protein